MLMRSRTVFKNKRYKSTKLASIFTFTKAKVCRKPMDTVSPAHFTDLPLNYMFIDLESLKSW